MKRTTKAKGRGRPRECSVERTIDILGDRWALLILREAFFGARHYDEFQERLGIATNVLSGRLKSLVEHEVLERRQDDVDRRRVIYALTERGLDLYSVTLALMQWGDKWLAGKKGPPLVLEHTTCGHALAARMCCDACGEAVDPREVSF